MGRTAAGPGIAHYPMESDHTSNKKIRLLFIAFQDQERQGGNAYWTYCCILDWCYRQKGYYFNAGDEQEMVLFSSEHCRLSLEFINRVISKCLDLGLFDRDLYNKYKVLSSERIQLNYLFATYERRRKGRRISMNMAYFLISAENEDISAEKYVLNVFTDDLKPLSTWINEYFPRNNSQIPRKSTHSIVYSTVLDTNVSNTSETKVSEETKNGGKPERQKAEEIGGEKKKSSAKRKRTKLEDTTPHFVELREQFTQFIAQNYDGVRFSWNGTEAANFCKLLRDLQARAEDQGKEWDIGVARLRLANFLSTAFLDKFLHDDFAPSMLYHKRNKIFLNCIKPENNGRSSASQQNGQLATEKRTTKADERIQRLASAPERIQALADQLAEDKRNADRGDRKNP